MAFTEFYERMKLAHEQLKLKPGDIYESCRYHPVLCLGVDYQNDEIWGVSLIDGTHPCSCSMVNCGVKRLSPTQAWEIKMRGPLLPADRERVSEEHRWWNASTNQNTDRVRFTGPREERPQSSIAVRTTKNKK